MPFFSRGPSIPAGWVQAPGDVQAEVFLVWQEDELPDELTQAPGYVPFTLSPAGEAWVRGMAEIRELDTPNEKIVIGRPRPASAAQHRPLIPEPPAPAPAAPASASAPTWEPRPAPVWEPSISAKEWVRRQAPRAAPAIAIRTEAAGAPSREDGGRPVPRALPAIGGSARAEPTPPTKPASQVRSVPQIGPSNEPAGAPPVEAQPEQPPEQREKPRHVPEIGPP